MSLYEYQAITRVGKKIKGIISASSVEETKTVLQQDSLIILKISLVVEKDNKNLTKKDVLYITSQLENLLASGLPLYEALSILAEKDEKKKYKLLLLNLCEKLKLGYTLSEAMREYPKTFDSIICSMIENSQKTARLQECLNEISTILNSSIQLKKRLISAITYPLILFIFCFLILNFLLFISIPALSDLFEGRTLHPFTKIVFCVSKFACKYKFFIFLGLITTFCFGFISYLYDPIKKKIYEKILKLPVIKLFMIKVSLVRFCISFANLLKGGESYVNSLVMATNVLNHPILEKEIRPLKDKLIEGKHLSELLKNNPYIPDGISKMLAIAEETSQMPKMLLNIAKIYEEEVDKSLSKITTIFQPVLLIILGLIVGFVVLSILIPLTDVSSFLGD
jgi:general secretion pathway protein F